MLSVGILARDPGWARALIQSGTHSEFSMAGWLAPVRDEPTDIQLLLDHSDLIWIPEKINGHMDEAVQVIRRSKHLLLGFPVSDFIDDALNLLKLAQEAQIQVQVGHHDRYQPAMRSCLPFIHQPQTIYLSRYLFAIAVPEEPLHLLKELVSDLDLVLPLISNSIRKIRIHPTYNKLQIPHMVDVNIEFHNSALVSLHYTTLTPPSHRMIKIIQTDRLLEINLTSGISRQRLLEQACPGDSVEWQPIWPSSETDPGSFLIPEDVPDRLSQCLSFIHALTKGKNPVSPLEDGFMALETARLIHAQIFSY